MRKRLFFDIEVSPNIVFSWRAGYKLNIDHDNIIEERKIICICWKWEGKDEIYSLQWDKKQDDKKLLKDFIKILDSAHEIVGHNSDKFDVKWLRTRCLFHGVDMFPNYVSIDTLKHAKSGFYFNSNKLNYIAKFLNVGQKMDNGGFDTWRKIVLDKDEAALNTMVEYCKQDVAILEKVYNKLQPYIKNKSHYGTLWNEEKYSCPECSSYNVGLHKRYTTNMGTLRYSMQCNECKKVKFTISHKSYQDLLTYKITNGLIK
jgi:DNA polymerase elongation subunit (family B)